MTQNQIETAIKTLIDETVKNGERLKALQDRVELLIEDVEVHEEAIQLLFKEE